MNKRTTATILQEAVARPPRLLALMQAAFLLIGKTDSMYFSPSEDVLVERDQTAENAR
jgi:hypothetical protein